MKNSSQKFFGLSGKIRGKADYKALIKLLLVIFSTIIAYSLIFMLIMEKVEGRHFSWISGLYWVFSTMGTAGFGDIVFESEIGKLYSILVITSGTILLLIVLPYSFITFILAPLVEERIKTRIPKSPTTPLKNHIIIGGEDTIAINLIKKLRLTNQSYVLVEEDPKRAEFLFNAGYEVINGDLAKEETLEKVNIDGARILFANQSDVRNSHIALTARGLSELPIIALAEISASQDILQYAGCNHVVPVKEIMGKYLANRCSAGSIHSNVMGSLENLDIVEVPVYGTPFLGKKISELKIRETTGVNIIGLWERGRFSPPDPEFTLSERSILLLMGEEENLLELDTYMSIYIPSDNPIIIIGAGAVGVYVARELDKKEVPYYLVDSRECKEKLEHGTFILGDAKEREVLDKAGIEDAPTAVITTSDDGINGYLTLYCRALNKKLRIVTRANLEKNLNAIHKAGADFVVSYTMIGTSIVNNILQKGALTLLAEGLHIFRYPTPPSMIGQTISQSNVGSLTGCSIIAVIKKGNLVSTPDPLTLLEREDLVIMIGSVEQEEQFKERFL